MPCSICPIFFSRDWSKNKDTKEKNFAEYKLTAVGATSKDSGFLEF